MQNIKSDFVALAIVLTIVLGGCQTSAPILNIKDSPVAAAKPLQANQVRNAIIVGGANLGWQIVDAGQDKLKGTLRLREHLAVVDIPYSSKSYSIILISSVNLNERDGQIHRNYNSWAQNLDTAIRAQLLIM